MKNPKPEPVVVTIVCSLCGLAWEAHGEAPSLADCVRLLKAELAKRPVQTWTTGGVISSGIIGSSASNTTRRRLHTLSEPDEDEPPEAVPA